MCFKSTIIIRVETYYNFRYICSVFLSFYFELLRVIKWPSQLQNFFEPKVILSLFNKPFNGLGLEEFVGNDETKGSIPFDGSSF